MSNNNPCAKKVTPENAYAVYASENGQFMYFVLKKYKSPKQEAKDPFAKWHVAAQSPALSSGSFEYGDMYISRVTEGMKQIDNPLCSYLCLRLEETFLPSTISRYRFTQMRFYHSRLVNYIRLQVPKKEIARVRRILKEHSIHVVCQDVEDFTLQCLNDSDTSEQQE